MGVPRGKKKSLIENESEQNMQTIGCADDCIKKFYNKIKPQWKTAFIGTVIIGILTYAYTMSNHFLTYDSMWNLYSNQDMITSGRQFLMYACGIGSYYDLPWINGLLAVFYLALAAVVVTEGLGIQSKTGALLAGGLLVTFPSIASTFCYTYTIDGYMLAVLLAALAFLLTDRKKWGFAGGVVLLGISMGIYQAYLSFTIVLCILRLLLDLIEKDEIKEIFAKMCRYIVMGIGSYLFYVVTLKVMLKIKDTEISGYQGTDRIGSFSPAELPEGLKAAWHNFIDFARWSNVLTGTEVMKYAFVSVAVLAVILFLVLFLKEKRYKSVLRIVMMCALVAAIPFGATIVNILSPGTYFHLLMRLPWALFFVFAVAICERMTYDGKKIWSRFKKIMVYGVCLFSTTLIFSFAVMANVVVFNMNERYEKTYATCIRLVERIEQTEGYTTGTKVAILGGYPDYNNYPATDITGKDLVSYFGSNGELCVNSTEKYAEFFRHYMNVTITTIPESEEIDLTLTEAFHNMPNFPAEGSVGFIGDVLVIKLNG